MPTYSDYVQYAYRSGFQPFSEQTFAAMLRAGFNPITKVW